MSAPLIGITCDVVDLRYQVGRAYAAQVTAAGGVPVLLPCETAALERYLDLCDGVVLTGGDDPVTEPWGVATHPRATPIDAARQAFEVALLDRVGDRPEVPVLGICLGMQLMALHAGGALDQFLPETLETAGDHWGRVEHRIEGPLGEGTVLSHHRQAVAEPGSLEIVARAPDGVIEAIRGDGRSFYVGVQWHPERTEDPALGPGIIRSLVEAAAS